MGSPDVPKSTHPTNKRKRPHGESSENISVPSSPKTPPESISRPSKRARRTSEGQRAPPSPQSLPSPSAQPKDGEESTTPQQKLEKQLWEMDKLSYLRLSHLGRPDAKHHANEWYHSLLAPPQIALVNPRDATSALDHGVHGFSPKNEDDDDATIVGDPEEDETRREARTREEKTKDAIPLEQVVFPCQHWVDEIGPRAGCPILNSKVLMTLRRGSTSLITLRSGHLGCEQFKYLNKSWPLARLDLLKNLFTEAALYQSEQHLGNSNLAPKFYGVFVDSTSVPLATALPSPRFWINAHPGMPHDLKRLVFDALDALHERGILLGRVVLRNILITAAKEVHFTEFSSARVVVQPAGAVVPLPFATKEDFRHEKKVMRRLLRDGHASSAPPQRVVVPGQKIVQARCALNWFLGGLEAELYTTRHGAQSYGNIKRMVPDELETVVQGNDIIQKRIAELFSSKQYEVAAAREQMFDDMDDRVNAATQTHPTRPSVRFTDPETTPPPRTPRSPPPHGFVIPAKGVLRNVGERLYVNKRKLVEMDHASERLDEETLRRQWFDTSKVTRMELFFVMRIKTRELTGISSRHVQPPILF